MKPKTMILMVVAVGCGLAASYMTSKYISGSTKPQEVEEVQVLVAKARVPGWTTIKDPKQYFDVKMYRKTDAPKRSLSTFEEVKDQKLNKPINESSTVSLDDLLNKGDQRLTDKLPKGHRAIGLKVNVESSAAGFVLPETYVDVNWVSRSGQESKLVFQNVKVLAVDTQQEPNPEQKNMVGQTLTIAAPAEEIVAFELAKATGTLTLALKGQDDKDLLPTIVKRPDDLNGNARKPVEETTETPAVASRNTESVLPDVKQPEEEKKPQQAAAAKTEESKVVEKKDKPWKITIFEAGNVRKEMIQKEEGEDETAGDPNAPQKDQKDTKPAARKTETPRTDAPSNPPAGNGSNRVSRKPQR